MSHEYEVKIQGERVNVAFSANGWDYFEIYQEMPQEVKELASGGDEALDDFEMTEDVFEYTGLVLRRVTDLPDDVIESMCIEMRFKLFSAGIHVTFKDEIPDNVEEEIEYSSDFKYESEQSFETDENGAVDLEDWQ